MYDLDRERMDSSERTLIVPITVARYFRSKRTLKLIELINQLNLAQFSFCSRLASADSRLQWRDTCELCDREFMRFECF